MLHKPQITPELLRRLCRANEEHGHVFHILLDDDNVGRDNAMFCLKLAVETGDDEIIDVAVLLSRMSRTQHLKLSKMVHGLWR